MDGKDKAQQNRAHWIQALALTVIALFFWQGAACGLSDSDFSYKGEFPDLGPLFEPKPISDMMSEMVMDVALTCVSAGLTYGAGELAGSLIKPGMSVYTQAAIKVGTYGGAGAISGAIRSAAYDTDVGKGALIGGITGGISGGVGSLNLCKFGDWGGAAIGAGIGGLAGAGVGYLLDGEDGVYAYGLQGAMAGGWAGYNAGNCAQTTTLPKADKTMSTELDTSTNTYNTNGDYYNYDDPQAKGGVTTGGLNDNGINSRYTTGGTNHSGDYLRQTSTTSSSPSTNVTTTSEPASSQSFIKGFTAKYPWVEEALMGAATSMVLNDYNQAIAGEIYLNTVDWETGEWDEDKAEFWTTVASGAIVGALNAPGTLGEDVASQIGKDGGASAALKTIGAGVFVGGLTGLGSALAVDTLHHYLDDEDEAEDYAALKPFVRQAGGIAGLVLARTAVNPATYHPEMGTYEQKGTHYMPVDEKGNAVGTDINKRAEEPTDYNWHHGKFRGTITIKEGESISDYAKQYTGGDEKEAIKLAHQYAEDISWGEGKKYSAEHEIIYEPLYSSEIGKDKDYRITRKSEIYGKTYVDISKNEWASSGEIAKNILSAVPNAFAAQWPRLLGTLAAGYTQKWMSDGSNVDWQKYTSLTGEAAAYTTTAFAQEFGSAVGLIYRSPLDNLEYNAWLKQNYGIKGTEVDIDEKLTPGHYAARDDGEYVIHLRESQSLRDYARQYLQDINGEDIEIDEEPVKELALEFADDMERAAWSGAFDRAWGSTRHDFLAKTIAGTAALELNALLSKKAANDDSYKYWAGDSLNRAWTINLASAAVRGAALSLAAKWDEGLWTVRAPVMKDGTVRIGDGIYKASEVMEHEEVDVQIGPYRFEVPCPGSGLEGYIKDEEMAEVKWAGTLIIPRKVLEKHYPEQWEKMKKPAGILESIAISIGSSQMKAIRDGLRFGYVKYEGYEYKETKDGRIRIPRRKDYTPFEWTKYLSDAQNISGAFSSKEATRNYWANVYTQGAQDNLAGTVATNSFLANAFASVPERGIITPGKDKLPKGYHILFKNERDLERSYFTKPWDYKGLLPQTFLTPEAFRQAGVQEISLTTPGLEPEPKEVISYQPCPEEDIGLDIPDITIEKGPEEIPLLQMEIERARPPAPIFLLPEEIQKEAEEKKISKEAEELVAPTIKPAEVDTRKIDIEYYRKKYAPPAGIEPVRPKGQGPILDESEVTPLPTPMGTVDLQNLLGISTLKVKP